MRAVSPASVAQSILASDRSDSVFAINWQRIVREAKLYWPRHTAKHLARVTGASPRTCYRWLADDAQPPASAIVSIVLALRAEYVARGRIFEQLEMPFS